MSAELRLVPTDCPLCGADEAEPIAVGQDFGWAAVPDAFLALRCRRCQLLYLNPRPAPEESGRLYPPACFTAPGPAEQARRRAVARRALRLCPPLPAGARVLEVGYGAYLHREELLRAGAQAWNLETVTDHRASTDAPRSGVDTVTWGRAEDLAAGGPSYDAALLLHSLEHCDRPAEELSAIHRLLKPGSPVIVLTHNSESTVSRMFAGRHWVGYDFPRHPCLFSPTSLRALAGSTGFEVERMETLRSPETWTESVRWLLRDWDMPGPLVWVAGGGLGQAAAYVAEHWAQLRHHGELLGAVLRTSGEGRQ